MKVAQMVIDILVFVTIVANIAISLDANNIHAFGAWIVSYLLWTAKMELSARLEPPSATGQDKPSEPATHAQSGKPNEQ